MTPPVVSEQEDAGSIDSSGRIKVSLSSLGKELSLTSQQAKKQERDKDIDDSSLPDGIKDILKRIRDLKEQIQQKLMELQRVQASDKGSEAEKKQELERVQSELTSLNAALASAHAMLNKVMDDIELGGEGRMEVADLLMK
ncbi:MULTISPECIES: hypothetical protein [Alcaligenes]|uniref:Uncharacterized protein n=1 Tax=Alcaligenes phenolicus TaxID=232846 RepID=A0AAW5VXF1_9BURK|nr:MULTISPECIES: hypothetical protein [Alcaligenes]MCR4144377.1 hypothetical protein [Alcaligenes faecalis]MCX5565543.1 hypothetical protein [Alcaligenes phenolicus]